MLVVGMRLGCLNHALLSAAAIRSRGLHFAGWVANCIDPQMHAVKPTWKASLHGCRHLVSRPSRGARRRPFTAVIPRAGAMTFPRGVSGRLCVFRANILGFGSNWRQNRKSEVDWGTHGS
jgi:hypothetical protein